MPIPKQARDTSADPLKKTDQLWVIQDHICRSCFGRVLSTPHGESYLWRCSNCGREETGDEVSAICCCGITYKRGGRRSRSAAPINAGIRCIRNPQPSAEFSCEIVASEVAYDARR